MQKDKNAKRQKDALHAHTLQEHILTFSRQAPHWFMLQAMYYIENPTMVSKRACLDFCRQDQLRPPCEASLGLAVIWQRLSAHFAQLCSVYNLHILHSLLEDTWQIHCAHHADYGCFFVHFCTVCESAAVCKGEWPLPDIHGHCGLHLPQLEILGKTSPQAKRQKAFSFL